MACMHPMPAWRTHAGVITMGKKPGDFDRELLLPCGGCLGCRESQAKGWALRCLLELKEHNSGTFTTLTYDPENEPVTLSRRHLQLFIKKLRKRRGADRIRFFACGEYGEKNGRPHYHAILYGLDADRDKKRIDEAWGMGHVQTVPVTPAAIAYTAGYAAKKIGYKMEAGERIDYETGEVYEWQPPFLQMSRRPGIGAAAREKYPESWKDYGVLNGAQIPVPTFLNKGWKDRTTKERIEEHEHEKYQRSLTRHRPTRQQLDAEEKIAMARQGLRAEKRKI